MGWPGDGSRADEEWRGRVRACCTSSVEYAGCLSEADVCCSDELGIGVAQPID